MSTGGCKHALELLMWTHRRSEDPTPTEVDCYWKKSRLSSIGTVIKYIEAEKLTKKPLILLLKIFRTIVHFYKKLLNLPKINKFNSQIGQLNFDLESEKACNLSLHRLILDFTQSTDLRVDKFLEFAKTEIAEAVCKKKLNC